MLLPMLIACVATKDPTDSAETDTDTDVSADDTAPPEDTAPAPPETFVGEVGVVFTDFGASDRYFCAVLESGRVFCWTRDWSPWACNQPPSSLRLTEVSVPHYGEENAACGVDATSGDAVCWSAEGVTYIEPGPFLTVSGYCGIRVDGSLDCWERFDMCPISPPTTGSYTALDAREYGTAVRDDGAIVTWSGPCVEWGGVPDSEYCIECPDRREVAGPFVAVSNVQTGGVCAAYAGGGVYCEALDVSLVAEAPSSGTFVDIDSYTLWADGGACALDADGATTCWGDDVAYSTAFVDIESNGIDTMYGLTPEGSIEEFNAAYPDDWIPCDPAVE